MVLRSFFLTALIAIVTWQNSASRTSPKLVDDIQTFSVSPDVDDFGDRFITNIDLIVGKHHDELLSMSPTMLEEHLTNLVPQNQAFLIGCWIRVRSDADEQLVETLKSQGLGSPTYNLEMVDEASYSKIRLRRAEGFGTVDSDLFRFECKGTRPQIIFLCCTPNASSNATQKEGKYPARLRVSWWIGANYLDKLTVVSYRIERGWETSPFRTSSPPR